MTAAYCGISSFLNTPISSIRKICTPIFFQLLSAAQCFPRFLFSLMFLFHGTAHFRFHVFTDDLQCLMVTARLEYPLIHLIRFLLLPISGKQQSGIGQDRENISLMAYELQSGAGLLLWSGWLAGFRCPLVFLRFPDLKFHSSRSEERRVGKECGS